ncbi:MAG: hypothetical protein M1838_003162 [Thelocarpon superellum]|nr:MAG: hypothetical protein M1838_003162 [Thelocarpon superellum]
MKSSWFQQASKKTHQARPAPRATKAPTPPASSSIPLRSHVSRPPAAKYLSYADTLARRPSPTLLYRAPSHTLYKLGSYGFGGFCLSYAGYNFYAHYLYPPEGLSPWVPVAFGGVCFAMTCAGTWLLLGPARLIRTMTAIPLTTTSAPTLAVRLELRRTWPIPFLQPRTVEAAASDLTLSSRLFDPPPEAIHPAEARRRLEQEREYELSHLLTAPFRHMSYFFWRILTSLGRVWTRDGFVKVRIKGRNGAWKLDGNGGWALDGGRAVDRLIRVHSL